jgi:hypothetical protein
VKDLSATAEFDQLDLGDARREARVPEAVNDFETG